MLRLTVVVGSFIAAASAPAWGQTIDYGRSQISVLARQMNVPVEVTPFKRFTAQIAFDSNRPEASKARVEIDLMSFDIGDPDINENAKDRNWFDAKNHPSAVFASSSVRALGSGRYEARGPLTLKGRTHEVVAPFTLRMNGADRIFEGTFPIRRLQFNIGDGAWRDTSVVADEVQIKFRLYQTAPKPAPKA